MRSVIEQINAPMEKLLEAGAIRLYCYKPSPDEVKAAAEGYTRYMNSMLESQGFTVRTVHGEAAVAHLNAELLNRNLPDVPEFIADLDFLYPEDEWFCKFKLLDRLRYLLGFTMMVAMFAERSNLPDRVPGETDTDNGE